METLTAHLPALRAGRTARILYVNASGSTSERTIDVQRRFSGHNGVTYLRAYCHLRTEDRTFRLDRVLAVMDTEAHRDTHEVGRAAAAVATTHRPRPASPELRPIPQRTSSPVPARHEPSGRGAHALRTLFVGVLVVIGLAWIWDETHESSSAPRFLPPPAPPVAVVDSAPAPVKRPDTTWSDEYRGQRIEAVRRDEVVTFTLAASGRRFGNVHSLRVAVNESLLSASLGVHDGRLTQLFGNADTDRDGSLSWAEIQTFQTSLDSRYRYLPNHVALRPSEFIDRGGGDCEDWALMTATLLHFWGVEARIGGIQSETGFHAVALVAVSEVPEGFLEITVTSTDPSVPTSYVPIDYTRVGGLSNAVGRSYVVTHVWRPEEMFGKPL